MNDIGQLSDDQIWGKMVLIPPDWGEPIPPVSLRTIFVAHNSPNINISKQLTLKQVKN